MIADLPAPAAPAPRRSGIFGTLATTEPAPTSVPRAATIRGWALVPARRRGQAVVAVGSGQCELLGPGRGGRVVGRLARGGQRDGLGLGAAQPGGRIVRRWRLRIEVELAPGRAAALWRRGLLTGIAELR